MKKDRNTFFQESQFYNQTNMPNPGFNNLNVANAPFTTGSYATQGFYAGNPNQIPMNYTTQMPQNTNYNNYDFSDIESRISKIERQINRIDARLTKLESGNFYTTEDLDTTNNIYMV